MNNFYAKILAYEEVLNDLASWDDSEDLDRTDCPTHVGMARTVLLAMGAKRQPILPETYPGVTDLVSAKREYQRLTMADDGGGENERLLLRLYPEANQP